MFGRFFDAVPLADNPVSQGASNGLEPSANARKSCLSPWQRKRLVVPGIAALVALALIPVGDRLYLTVHHYLHALPLEAFFTTAVQFASPTVTIGTMLIIWVCDPPKRRMLGYCLAALLIAGTMNNIIKQATGRVRPEWGIALNARREAELMRDENIPASQVENLKKGRWYWFRTGSRFLEDRYASFPSGHACSVFVMAAFLCLVYPQASAIWIIAAVSCALARVRFERHYPEDVMVGGALGWIVALWVFSWCWPMRMGEKLELLAAGLTAKRNRKSAASESTR